MSEEPLVSETPLPKVDPETLCDPAPASAGDPVQRGVIIAIAAIGSVSLIAVTWMALKPTVFSHVAESGDCPSHNGRRSADALNGLPAGLW